MNLLIALFFFLSVILVGLLPFRLLYILSDINRFVIGKVIRYRNSVIDHNLQLVFPEMSTQERTSLKTQIFKNLADVFLEGIRSFTISRNQIRKRHRIVNPEVLEKLYQNGRNIIGVTAHYGNWEWGSLSANLYTHYRVIAFYKPLSNSYIDKFIRWSRSRFGTILASIRETTLTFERYKDTRTIFLMASDQSPARKQKPKAYWVKFLNQDTAFLHGLENHARNNDCSVVYVDVQRVRRGYYTIELSILTERPNELKPGELTQLYAQKLESIILKKPENWLWSHRRWKLTR